MVSMTRARYARVNGEWPAGKLPELEAGEAVSAAKRLYRFGMGKAWTGPVRLTSGRRFSWVSRRVLVVNPEGGHGRGGWRDLVHDLSHYVHSQVNPGKAPHDPRHARIEAEMIGLVLSRGWLEGKLRRPTAPKVSAAEKRAAAVRKRLAAWEAKLRRAETALKKLRRQAAYYERRAA